MQQEKCESYIHKNLYTCFNSIQWIFFFDFFFAGRSRYFIYTKNERVYEPPPHKKERNIMNFFFVINLFLANCVFLMWLLFFRHLLRVSFTSFASSNILLLFCRVCVLFCVLFYFSPRSVLFIYLFSVFFLCLSLLCIL